MYLLFSKSYNKAVKNLIMYLDLYPKYNGYLEHMEVKKISSYLQRYRQLEALFHQKLKLVLMKQRIPPIQM